MNTNDNKLKFGKDQYIQVVFLQIIKDLNQTVPDTKAALAEIIRLRLDYMGKEDTLDFIVRNVDHWRQKQCVRARPFQLDLPHTPNITP